MKTLKSQKRIAAAVLNVGQNRVVFDKSRLADIKEAITRQDIRDLIKEGIIKVKEKKPRKKRSLKKRLKRKRKGRKRGHGKIKKKIKERKKKYISLIRNLRRYLKNLKNQNLLDSKNYNKLRRLAKAGFFSDKKNLENYLIQNKIIKERK